MNRRLAWVTAFALVTAGVSTSLSLAGRGEEGKRVDVTLRDFRFVGPSKVQAGPTEFYFANKGKVPHNYTIIYTSTGATKFKSQTIQPGKTQELEVNLKPGSYLAICTVFNGFHVAQGMVRRFTVGTIDFKTGKWK
jgi:hypothetical protein